MLKSIFQKVKKGFSYSKNILSDEISRIFSKEKGLDDLLSDLSDLMIRSDVGIEVTERIISIVRREGNVTESNCKKVIQSEIMKILASTEGKIITEQRAIILLCGINGNGKTTTIGKLVDLYTSNGQKVVVAAADTFRAAAQEQLSQYLIDYDIHIEMARKECEDPGSVVYRAIQYFNNHSGDVLIIDTAGRLHTSSDLMQQLRKIDGIIDKSLPNVPKYNIICVDANSGQNVLNQVQEFQGYIPINGGILTKMDGYAKGGVIVNVANMYPDFKIYYLGVGESVKDLKSFDKETYIKFLLSLEDDKQ